MTWQFRLRDLFLLTVITALVVVWWLDHSRTKSLLDDANKRAADSKLQMETLATILEVHCRTKVRINPDGSLSVQDMKGKLSTYHWD